MRLFIDTNVLLGKIIPNDPYHESASEFFGGFRYGQLEIVCQVLSDLTSMINKEANFLLRQFHELCPLQEIQDRSRTDRKSAKDMFYNTMNRIKKVSRACHLGVKEAVEKELLDAIDEGRFATAVESLSISLPKEIEYLVSGCLGPEFIGTMLGLPVTDSEKKISRSINVELARERGIFGKRDEADRRILSGLILESRTDDPITFYTYDPDFFKGYRTLWQEGRSVVFDPAKQLDFVLLDNDNIKQMKRFSPATMQVTNFQPSANGS